MFPKKKKVRNKIIDLKSSLDDKLLTPPQLESDKKSTGLVTCGIMGNLKKKSNS